MYRRKKKSKNRCLYMTYDPLSIKRKQRTLIGLKYISIIVVNGKNKKKCLSIREHIIIVISNDCVANEYLSKNLIDKTVAMYREYIIYYIYISILVTYRYIIDIPSQSIYKTV